MRGRLKFLLDDARSSLAAITSVPGVSFAVVMDRGGFVIESSGEMEPDAEDVAALASCLLESSDEIGRELGRGPVGTMVCEFADGLMLVMNAGPTTRLAVLLRESSALEAVRQAATHVIPALAEALTSAR
jgi:predicted regulator of Ras-like GTPase activity (Roadblock/LC7/MglB family)